MRAFKSRMSPAALVEGKDPAYVGDGLSRYSHIAAKSKQPRPAAVAPRSIRDVIKTEEYKLRRMYAKHRAGIADPVELAKLRKNIDIAQAFVAKLYSELGAAKRKGLA